jgi:hypothetical protein
MKVVPDDTIAMRGVEQHTFICSACHVTERRMVFTIYGRDDETEPRPLHAVPRVKRASTERDQNLAVPGLLDRVMALLRGL